MCRSIAPFLLAASVVAASSATAITLSLALESPPEPVARYEIAARYDPETGVISATERVRWTNPTRSPAGELRFHLYLNGFRDRSSTWMKERRRPESSDHPAFGGIDLIRVLGSGGQDWTQRLEFIAPDDGNAADRTVVRLGLDEPVEPGESVTVDLQFEARMPGIWARTGRAGDYIAGAQWFPSLGVFEGEPAHWNCHQFHAFTEFYADFGEYHVTLNLPQRYRGKVAATGVLEQERDDEQGWYSVTYHAQAVHDFVFFADPRFIVRTRRFAGMEHRDVEAERRWLDVLGAEVRPEQMLLRDVEVEVYLQPEHLHLEERHFRAVFAGLEWFGRAFGAYPYGVLRVIDPPRKGRRSGGMEYAQVFAGGAHILSPPGHHSPEGVLLHEFGHQYFQGLLASNEMEDAFLDEGFDTFASSMAAARKLGPSRMLTSFGPIPFRGRPLVKPAVPSGPLSWLARLGAGELLGVGRGSLTSYFLEQPSLTYQPVARSFPWPQRSQWLDVYGLDQVRRFGWTYPNFQTYRMHTYRLTALSLESYRRAAGEKALFRALRRYVEAFRYRHPHPDDFIDAADEVMQRMRQEGEIDPVSIAAHINPRRYFHQLWSTPGWVDFSVEEVDCVPAAGADRPDPGDGSPSDCRVLIRRRGPWRLPVVVELNFADGGSERVLWEGDRTWERFETSAEPALESVVVDPDRVWVIDVDLTNNQWSRSRRSEESWRLLLAVFHRFAERLLGLGRLG